MYLCTYLRKLIPKLQHEFFMSAPFLQKNEIIGISGVVIYYRDSNFRCVCTDIKMPKPANSVTMEVPP